MNKLLSVLIFFIVASLYSPQPIQAELPMRSQPAVQLAPLASDGRIALSPQLQAALPALQAGEKITVIVTLKDQAQLPPGGKFNRRLQQTRVVTRLQAHAKNSRKALDALVKQRQGEGKVDQVTPFWIFNGMSLTADGDVIHELAAHPDVLDISADLTFVAPVASLTTGSAQTSLDLVGATQLWSAGFRGQGIVVANLDTGVDGSQPDLARSWRGGTNSWFDPYGEHPDTPTDVNGHGTWTMGILVGGSGTGMDVGVAPEAQWIAARVFNDQNAASITALHLAFQWILDPDGDPSTPDAPHVVNSSWGFITAGCYMSLQEDLKALRAAGILPIFAAGNSGPLPNSSVSPANYAEAFSVGAIDISESIYVESSRGPSACAADELVTFPDIVAPGVGIISTGLNGSYVEASGTSMAAPHVTGGLALLLSAFPDLSVDEQEQLLISSSFDLGPAGPDNDYGYGRLDLWAAYQSLLEASTPPIVKTPVLLSEHIFIPIAIR